MARVIGSDTFSPPRIRVICGPMFAGKTTQLLRMHQQALATLDMATERVLLVKYVHDTRYGSGAVIKTHDQAAFMSSGAPAYAVKRLAECEAIIDTTKRYSIFIDEGQFFEDLESTALQWHAAGHTVVVAALDYNYLRCEWSHVSALTSHADCVTVDKLKSTCARCNQPNSAEYTELIDGSVDSVVIVGGGVGGGGGGGGGKTVLAETDCIRVGGKEMYQPCCEACWPTPLVLPVLD